MILRCNFEELAALRSGAREYLTAVTAVGRTPEASAHDALEELLQRLGGDIGIDTLDEQQRVERAVEQILACARERMDAMVLEQYVGAEDAVNAYFDYAHVLTVHDRVSRMGQEMTAMIELMTGEPPTAEVARDIYFPE